MHSTVAGLDRPVPAGVLIAGRWRPASDADTYTVIDPADGSGVATFADASVTDARAALDAAADAQPGWAAVPARQRATLLRAAHDLFLSRAEDLAVAVVRESGKPLAEARGEVAGAAEVLLWSIEQIAHVHGTIAPASHGGFDVLSRYAPIGPSLMISPWNFPQITPMRKLAAALAAGCTVIHKPAAQAILSGALTAEVFLEAGLPAGVLNLLPTTRDREISAALMDDPRLRKVSFTGSNRGGEQILRQSARHTISTSLELGGDGPFLMLADADVDLAVEHAMLAKFRNAGQVCVAANRFLVHEAVAEQFTAALVARTEKLVVGPGLADGTQVGPMISEAQRERTVAMLEHAVRGGARVLTGGHPLDGPGFYFAPTVVVDIPPGTALSCEELFAPVATIFRVGSTEEAVALANDTERGLAAYVFSRDLAEALDVADRLEVGMVGINRGVMTDPAAPFGGVKSSGLGREGGQHALHEYLEVKYIALTR